MSVRIAPRSHTWEDANIPSLSRLRERGRGRGAFASALSQATKRFRAPAGARVPFSLLAQRERNQRETAPRWRALQASCLPGARAGYGVFRRDSCPGEKLARIPAGHPVDFPPPARRAIGAPAEQRAPARRSNSQSKSKSAALARRTAAASGAHDARPVFRGPLGGGEAGTTRPRSGHRQGWRCLFAGAGAPSKSPAPPHGLAGQDARQAPPRGAVSLWLLSLWASKEKVARAAAAARNRFETCGAAEAPLTPTLSPNDEPVGGEGSKAAQDVAPTSTGAQS